MSCGVGRRFGSDLALLWLWCRPVAAALIHSLAWKLPYATGAALKRKKGGREEGKKDKQNNEVNMENSKHYVI